MGRSCSLLHEVMLQAATVEQARVHGQGCRVCPVLPPPRVVMQL